MSSDARGSRRPVVVRPLRRAGSAATLVLAAAVLATSVGVRPLGLAGTCGTIASGGQVLLGLLVGSVLVVALACCLLVTARSRVERFVAWAAFGLSSASAATVVVVAYLPQFCVVTLIPR